MICVECGNDDAAYGYEVCTGCLTGKIPDGWYVLWCERCLSSLLWTSTEATTYPDGDWGTAVVWAAGEAHPHTCFGSDDADAAE